LCFATSSSGRLEVALSRSTGHLRERPRRGQAARWNRREQRNRVRERARPLYRGRAVRGRWSGRSADVPMMKTADLWQLHDPAQLADADLRAGYAGRGGFGRVARAVGARPWPSSPPPRSQACPRLVPSCAANR
jgi:hypothetical protein